VSYFNPQLAGMTLVLILTEYLDDTGNLGVQEQWGAKEQNPCGSRLTGIDTKSRPV